MDRDPYGVDVVVSSSVGFSGERMTLQKLPQVLFEHLGDRHVDTLNIGGPKG